MSAFTMTNVNEALGVARAAKKAGVPSVISFTLETDGRLPTGETLGEAIEAVDRASGAAPAYYMINCAHPTHFADVLEEGAGWVKRLRGRPRQLLVQEPRRARQFARARHRQPAELGEQYAELLRRFPHINVLGGCCGTDHRHIACIGEACCGHATWRRRRSGGRTPLIPAKAGTQGQDHRRLP